MDKKEKLELDSQCLGIAISAIALFIIADIMLGGTPFNLIAIDFAILGYRSFMTYTKTKEMHHMVALIGCVLVVLVSLFMYVNKYI